MQSVKSGHQHPECCDMKMTLSFSTRLPKGRLYNTNRWTFFITHRPCVHLHHCPISTRDNCNIWIVTQCSTQVFIHSPITYSESPTVFPVQSSKQRIQRWRDRVPALDGQKKINGYMRNQGNMEAAPVSTFTFLPLQPFLSVFPIWFHDFNI